MNDAVESARVLETLRLIDESLAQLASGPGTTMQALLGPILPPGHAIVQVKRLLPTRPVVFHVALTPDGGAVLTGRPDVFDAFLRRARVFVRDAETARQVAEAFLATTRAQDRRFLPLTSRGDLPWRPRLGEAEAQRRDEVLQRLPADITPRIEPAAGGGFAYHVWVVVGSDLERVTVALPAAGGVSLSRDSVERDLPLVYAA